MADLVFRSTRMKVLPMILASMTTLAVVSGCSSPSKSPLKRFDSLSIQGTPKFEAQVEKALALLKAQSPAGYATVTNYVGIVRENKHSGMEVHHKPPVFLLNGNSAYYSISWCAGVIAHDSFHSKLYFDYKKQHPEARWVPKTVDRGEEAERACLQHQLAVLKDIAAPASEMDWCRQSVTNQYWLVKYRNRNW